MDRGVWWVTVYGVTKESDMTEHSHTHTGSQTAVIVTVTVTPKALTPSPGSTLTQGAFICFLWETEAQNG